MTVTTTASRNAFKQLSVAFVVGGVMFVQAGCETTNGSYSDTVGALIGAGTGALLGSQVGGGSGRVVAGAAGAVLGAWIGREIARHLSQSGQKEMVMANQRALETGQPQVWEDPETGATGRTEVAERTTRQQSVPVKVQPERVDKIPPIDLIGATYVANSSSNVRGGPSTDYRSVGSLSSGQQVQVVGKVQGSDWYLIAEEGAANGFVASRLLSPLPVSTPAPAPAAGSGEVMMVEASQTCNINSTRVTQPDGEVIEDRIRICQGPDGYVIDEA
ncbi:SH3 domain-containing protein [Halomonas litopenaei]|uniref:SH3 domain-containing protein n=1 Tax=Halomonas litopenaei TaxID=2109328 RepID=UPI003FA0994B